MRHQDQTKLDKEKAAMEVELSEAMDTISDNQKTIKLLKQQIESLKSYKQNFVSLEANYIVAQSKITDLEGLFVQHILGKE